MAKRLVQNISWRAEPLLYPMIGQFLKDEMFSSEMKRKSMERVSPVRQAGIQRRKFAATLVCVFILCVGVIVCLEWTAGKHPGGNALPASGDEPTARRIGTFADPQIFECSGIAFSRKNKDCFWVHNDSGADPELFLVNSGGETIATCELTNVKNIDFEDLAFAEIKTGKSTSGFLAIGDIGDNLRRRKHLKIHLFPEPTFATNLRNQKEQLKRKRTIEFTFPDGARHNCEGLAYDQKHSRFLVCTKLDPNRSFSGERAEVFAVPFDLDQKTDGDRTIKNVVSSKVGDVQGAFVTACDFSPDGQCFVVQNYYAAYHYRIAGSTLETVLKKNSPTVVPLPFQRQSESICFDSTSLKLITTSEGKRSPIWEITLKSKNE